MKLAGGQDQAALLKFFTCMAVCHTVLPKDVSATSSSTSPKNSCGSGGGGLDIDYQGTSPDEVALVRGAAQVGCVFRQRKVDASKRSVLDIERPSNCDAGKRVKERYTILHVLEFTSDRKRMSVVVEDAESNIWLMVKGADQVMVPRFKDGHGPTATAISHTNSFAKEGLRTLLFGRKQIQRDVYEQWRTSFKEASVALVDREDQMGKVADQIEWQLEFIGVSAVEDRLQDDVPETISALLQASRQMFSNVYNFTYDKDLRN